MLRRRESSLGSPCGSRTVMKQGPAACAEALQTAAAARPCCWCETNHVGRGERRDYLRGSSLRINGALANHNPGLSREPELRLQICEQGRVLDPPPTVGPIYSGLTAMEHNSRPTSSIPPGMAETERLCPNRQRGAKGERTNLTRRGPQQ